MQKTVVISVNYGFGGSIMTVTNAKSSAESEKFTLKIRSDSGKLFTIGCHFPPKSTNTGLLGYFNELLVLNCTGDINNSLIQIVYDSKGLNQI